jgi:hypothetical protein
MRSQSFDHDLSPGQRLLHDARILEARLKKQAEDELKKRAEDERKRAKAEARYGSLLTKHRDLVDKFLAIAERKVSVLDDYGDPSQSERSFIMH